MSAFNANGTQATTLLEEHGSGLHAAGKSARLLDRMAELLSDGNLKVCEHTYVGTEQQRMRRVS